MFMDIKELELLIIKLVGSYGWLFIGAFVSLLLKDVVANVLAGTLFMVGSDFNPDDIVYIGGEKKARIVRQTPTKTIFHLLEVDRKLVVPNVDLYKLRVEKVLPSNGGPKKGGK